MSGAGDDWQAGKSLAETNKQMLERQIACDVIFIVGAEQKSIHAHKFMLVSRSGVFFDMFCGSMSGNINDRRVEVKDVEPEIFKTLLLFLYCEEAYVDVTNALPLLYVAKKYGVQSLIDKCSRRLKGLMQPDTVCLVLEQAHSCNQAELKSKCKQFIFQQPVDILKSDTFCDLSHSCLVELLESDDLGVTENLVLEAALRWSEKECQRNDQEITPENQRTSLGSALYLIRFPIMDQVYFSDHVSNEDIISAEEKVELFRYFCGQKKNLEHFSNRKRVNRLCFMRFQRVNSGWSYVQNKADAITFKTSQDLLLNSFFLYGSHQASTNYNIQYFVMNSDEEILAQQKTTQHSDGAQKMFEIVLEDKVRITAEEEYTIQVVLNGPSSYQGQEGRTTVTSEGVTVTFSNNETGTNGTNIGVGQIPGVVFSSLQED